MGSENLFHTRKQKSINSLKREKSKREPYDTVLIVCEGEKTEPNYLKGLCDELKLNTANIKLLGLGVDPLNIVDYALESNRSQSYDRIYCVFDKDQHSRYEKALLKVESESKNGVSIFSIASVPCFEYWLLLHFEHTSKPYSSVGDRTAAACLKNQIKKYIPNYSEGHKSIFELTKKKLPLAIKRAKIINQNQRVQVDNPSTNFHELVEYLQALKRKR